MHDEEAAGLCQPVAHDLDQERRVDVAAGEERADLVLASRLAGEHGSDRRRAGPLDQELGPLEQEHDRVADLLVRDGDDVVERVAQDEVSSPGCLTAIPSAIV